MFEIAICDDDVAYASQLRKQISEQMEARGASCRLRVYAEPSRLLAELEGGTPCDLLFLDILYGRELGVRFARHLRQRQWDIDLVFISTSAQFALDCYDVHPLHYLLKPASPERLSEVLDRFLERRTPRALCFPMPRQGMLRLAISDIRFFEIFDHTIVIHQRSGENSSWRGTLKELEGKLPPNCFVRTHRSFLVNLAYISRLERGQLRLSTGEFVPVSKSAYSDVQLALVAYHDGDRSALPRSV